MVRSKNLMIVVVAAVLGAAAGCTMLGELPAKAWASVMGPSARPQATPVPASSAGTAQNFIRIDGERSELRVGGTDTSLHANKDDVLLRTPFGNITLRW